MNIIREIQDCLPELRDWRQDIHAHPELAFEEHRTAALVAERLRQWGIEVHEGVGGTGVVGVLRAADGEAGPSVGLRADMDALPMQEENGFAHRSTTAGVFHGCGHDGHVTMLLAAARYLASGPPLPGVVNFIFQPAEEGRAGAQAMIEDGLFERFPCERVFALHNWPGLAEGSIGARAGAIMAASDTWSLELQGRGGHAAFPHETVDPVVVGAQIVSAYQTLVSRSRDPLRAAVLSTTCFHAGSALNVIPGQAVLRGTVRSLDAALRDQIEADMERMAASIAEAFGAKSTLRYTRGYPVTVNDAAATALATRAAASVVGEAQVFADLDPAMGSEDFAYLLQHRPGCYLWLGQGGGPTACGLHNPHYDFNDRVLPLGASLHVALARQASREDQPDSGDPPG